LAALLFSALLAGQDHSVLDTLCVKLAFCVGLEVYLYLQQCVLGQNVFQVSNNQLAMNF
jgi:hypothetical protein